MTKISYSDAWRRANACNRRDDVLTVSDPVSQNLTKQIANTRRTSVLWRSRS